MAVTVIIGSQWGDEGKGKIIDVLSDSSDFVVRFNGGNNAGHTVINQFGKFPMHLLPSGIFSRKAKACITNGVVLDLEVLSQEIEIMQKAGFELEDKLFISPRCHLILPYHKLLESLYEAAKGKGKTGTTGRGIGPVFADKVSYNGIRLYDLLDSKQFSEKLAVQLSIKNKIIAALSTDENLFPYRKHAAAKNKIMAAFNQKPLDQKEIEETFFVLREKILPFIKEPYPVIQQAVKEDKNILLEGAQAVLLDNDWGTYPFATASTILPGGINAYAGIPPNCIRNIIGVVKAYTTRVGEGPFPTELTDETGQKLQQTGGEFGATTGRPRRCGWFDAEMVRFAAEISGFTQIALTKLDVLDDFREIKICTGYTLNNKPVHYCDGDAVFLTKIKPVYTSLPGWKQSIRGINNYKDLPAEAKQYIAEIEKLTGVKTKYISTGPHRKEIIIR